MKFDAANSRYIFTPFSYTLRRNSTHITTHSFTLRVYITTREFDAAYFRHSTTHSLMFDLHYYTLAHVSSTVLRIHSLSIYSTTHSLTFHLQYYTFILHTLGGSQSILTRHTLGVVLHIHSLSIYNTTHSLLFHYKLLRVRSFYYTFLYTFSQIRSLFTYSTTHLLTCYIRYYAFTRPSYFGWEPRRI